MNWARSGSGEEEKKMEENEKEEEEEKEEGKKEEEDIKRLKTQKLQFCLKKKIHLLLTEHEPEREEDC